MGILSKPEDDEEAHMFDYGSITRELCPHCRSEADVSVIFERTETHPLPREDCWGQRTSVVQCHGCKALYFVHDTSASTNIGELFDEFGHSLGDGFTTDRAIYPEAHPRLDFTLPQNAGRYYADFLRAKALNLNTLAAIAARASLEALLVEFSYLNPDNDKDKLGRVLRRMEQNRDLLKEEFEALDKLKGAGDAAVHRAWFPSAEDVQHIDTIFRTVAMRLCQTPSAAQALAGSVPQRPQKPKK